MQKFSLSILIVLVLSFTAFKIQHLSLPFFWDEAWPYSTGVFYMYAHGLSLLPGSVPFDISRGHPLLFHLLAALWMKVSGASLTAIHIFPLLISILLLISMYFFCARFFSHAVALGSCLLLMTQPVFFSQSAMLLPEILVALLTLLALWTFLLERKLLYILFAALLLLTKESGVVIIISLFCWRIFEKIYRKEGKTSQVITTNFYWLIPVVIASIFFILQKIQTGYFFLPMYVGGENLSWEVFSEKLQNYFAYVFIYQGRNMLSLFLLVAVIIYVLRKIKLSEESKRTILPMLVFIVMYLLFSSFSFYSPRYMLSILPFFTIISSHLFFTAVNRKVIIYTGFLLITAAVSVSFCLGKKPVNDHSPGFADGISVTQSAINYCEEKNMQDEKMYSNFLARMHMTHPEHGYLTAEKKFSSISDSLDNAVRVCVFLSYELNEPLYNELKRQNGFNLVKRFEKNYAWSEVYEKK